MTDLSDLRRVAQAQYDRQRQRLAKVVAEETSLRTQIADLNERSLISAEMQTGVEGMRLIGADLRWQAWVSRSKTELNMRLARTLAQKAYEQSRVRHSFGKVAALEELIKTEAHQKRRARAGAQLQAAVTSAVLNPMKSQ